MIHRSFYPNRRPGVSDAPAIVKADNVVDAAGVKLRFPLAERSLSPDELKMLARWLYSLAHEAENLAQNGLITENQGYDLGLSKVVPRAVDIKS